MLLLTSPAERTRARLLALAYAELASKLQLCRRVRSCYSHASEVNAQLEYVGISADTTEADLKQREAQLPCKQC